MANTYSSLYFHVTFSTKKRQELITEEFQEHLWRYLGGIAREHKMKALKIGGVEDHVHLLLSLNPTQELSKAIQLLKGASSRWFNETYQRSPHFSWQDGYGAFSVSQSMLDTVSDYIKDQRWHHRQQTFQQEYIGLLQKHEVEYDPEYLWG